MEKKIRKKYSRNFCIGFRIEVPTKIIANRDIAKLYKKRFGSNNVFDFSLNNKVVGERHKDMILARGKEKFNGISNFSVMISLQEDQIGVERLVKIMNILGDGKIIKDKVKNFVLGKTVLNALPELAGLIILFRNLNEIMPSFMETAWFNAPDAKLR